MPSNTNSKHKGSKKKRPTARGADRYEHYQRAVNSPESDTDFLVDTYKKIRGKAPRHLREDFCGTAALSAEWIQRAPDRTAEGYDIDPEPVEWGRRHNFEPLGEAAQRMNFRLEDVMHPSRRRPDVRVASNFSYWAFHTRRELLGYARAARADLAPGGLFVLDLYGGPEATTEMEERRSIGNGITYVWDQKRFWPGTGQYDSAIHFEFKDGSRLKNAFTYSWRFWFLTEIKDVLEEAGFRAVETYFEGTDPDNPEEGDGIFRKDPRGENCEAWIGYLVSSR
jgi:SAM-dependent methyltransferase